MPATSLPLDLVSSEIGFAVVFLKTEGREISCRSITGLANRKELTVTIKAAAKSQAPGPRQDLQAQTFVCVTNFYPFWYHNFDTFVQCSIFQFITAELSKRLSFVPSASLVSEVPTPA